MKFTRFNLIFSQSMFLRLVSSFLIVIAILSSFHFISYNLFIDNIEYEIANNANERLDNVVNKLDKSMTQLKNIMLKLSLESFFVSISSGQEPSPDAQKLMVDTFNSYKMMLDYNVSFINTIFIIPAYGGEQLMTSESRYNTKSFFELFYHNPVYTRDFWEKEMQKDFTFKFYPYGEFIDKSHYTYQKDISLSLMPVAFKGGSNSRYIMVALIAIEPLFKHADEYFMNNFAVLDKNREILYSSIEDNYFKNIDLDNISQYSKTTDGYFFTKSSSENGLIYCRLLLNSKLKEQLHRTNVLFKLIIILSLVTSILISVYIVKRFNNPVKQIVDILKKSHDKERTSPGMVSFKYLHDSIQNLVTENSGYARALDSKNSLLKALSYQAGIKNIYPDIKSHLDIKRNYVVIYFKIHFKPDYNEKTSQDKSAASYYLTELIQLYMAACFEDCVTFQAENDQIVSVINISAESDIEHGISSIVNKLKSEEEYIFFTIVISKVYCDISELNKAYNRSLEISEYRAPVQETQILPDSAALSKCNKFCFSIEQEEKFINSLYNGQKQECLNIVENVLDYNFRKGVNCFYIKALCNEIVNCCIKALVKAYYDVPGDIEINSIYYNIKLSSTMEEFKGLLVNFVSLVADFIFNHQKQSDYIIDNITNYIEENYSKDIYVDLLAERLNLTSNYVSSYFKDKVGVNLNDYINNFRIRKSIELLETSPAKVKDIAAQVGIPNVNTFIRIFKKYVGKTPADYRKQLHITEKAME